MEIKQVVEGKNSSLKQKESICGGSATIEEKSHRLRYGPNTELIP